MLNGWCMSSGSFCQYNSPQLKFQPAECVGKQGGFVDIKNEVLSILDEVLSLKGRGGAFTLETPLLGAIPELDSMAVVALITTLEERFGFMVDDDEIDGAVFTSVGTLVDFVQGKLAA
jgi:acyl carrier protein